MGFSPFGRTFLAVCAAKRIAHPPFPGEGADHFALSSDLRRVPWKVFPNSVAGNRPGDIHSVVRTTSK